MNIKIKFNGDSTGKNIPEAKELVLKIGGAVEDNYYIAEFTSFNEELFLKLLKLIGKLKQTKIQIDEGTWFKSHGLRLRNNTIEQLILEGFWRERNFTHYPEGVNKITTLKKLNLTNNEFTTIPEDINQLSNLEYLDLTSNKIESLPKTFGQLTRLKYLNLNRNRIASLPDSIGQLVNLTYLNLSENRIKKLPDTIGNLVNLNTFIISPYLGKIYNTPYFKEKINVFLETIPNSILNLKAKIEPALIIPSVNFPKELIDKNFSKVVFEEREQTCLSLVNQFKLKTKSLDSFLGLKEKKNILFSNFKAKFEAILTKYQLEKYFNQLWGMLRLKIRIKPELTHDKDIPLGMSKLGGNPDFSSDMKWPYWEDRPLSFLLQLNISDIHELDLSEPKGIRIDIFILY